MTPEQKLRARLANELGVEMTVSEVSDAMEKTDALVMLVRGQNWNWLRDADTPGKLCMIYYRMQRILGTPLSWDEACRIRTILLKIDERVNHKPTTD